VPPAGTSAVPGLDITEIPETGAGSAPLAALGLGFVLVGAGLVGGAHGRLRRFLVDRSLGAA
jgi:LPXTG-motif cell wall-anchored protein